MSTTLVQGLVSGQISLEKAVQRLIKLPPEAIIEIVAQLSNQSKNLIEKKLLVLVYREIAKEDIERANQLLRVATDKRVPIS